MPLPFLLIDGYNLLHAAGLAQESYGPGDLEACRNRLLRQLSLRLDGAVVTRTTVVFDAFASEDGSDLQQTRHDLKVVFAPPGTDADSEIERTIVRHDAPRQLLVVSSDHRLHRAARRRKCQAVDSEPFWESLQDMDSSESIRSSPAQQNTAFWLREFGTGEDADTAKAADDIFGADYLSDLESELE